jgi:cell wall-associated NlpC family hydrolase
MPRLGTRRRARNTASLALVGIAATVVTAGAVTHAKADPLATAKAQAAALATTVDHLRTEAEVATERYDAAQSRLAAAVADRGRADQQLSSVQASATAAQQSVVDRARALYEAGGNSVALASLFSGQNPTEAVDRYRLADSVIAYSSRAAQAAAQTVVQAQALDDHAAAVSQQVTTLQVAQQSAATKVETLLAAQRTALASANATVRRIMKADQAAAAAASAADFSSAVSAVGGSIDLRGPVDAPSPAAGAAIAAARSRLGVPYVWGATGPDAFDCSGLTQWSYAHAGIALPRTSAQQWYAGPHPALSDLEPGDLLFWALNTSEPSTIHHVAMYLGHGMMIAAPHTGENVQIQPVYMTGFIGAVRPWAK